MLQGSGIFNSDGELWKFHRNMARPFFTRERTTDFEIFRRHSDHAVELIKQRCLTGEVIDLQVSSRGRSVPVGRLDLR